MIRQTATCSHVSPSYTQKRGLFQCPIAGQLITVMRHSLGAVCTAPTYIIMLIFIISSQIVSRIRIEGKVLYLQLTFMCRLVS
jgi:uncharacterized membrane protein